MKNEGDQLLAPSRGDRELRLFSASSNATSSDRQRICDHGFLLDSVIFLR